MSEGLGAVILLGITAVVVAAVLGVLTYGANQASDIAYNGYTFFDGLGKPEPLDALSEGVFPLAAAAAILRENRAQITTLDCRVCHTISSGDSLGECLKSHLNGRGRLTLSNNGDGGYTAMLANP